MPSEIPDVENLQTLLDMLARSGWVREEEDGDALRWLSSNLPAMMASLPPMTHPGSEPPAMDATTAETPPLERMVAAVDAAYRAMALERLNPFKGHDEIQKHQDVLRFLVAHLPALMAAQQENDALRGAIGRALERMPPFCGANKDGTFTHAARGTPWTEDDLPPWSPACPRCILSAARLAQGERTR